MSSGTPSASPSTIGIGGAWAWAAANKPQAIPRTINGQRFLVIALSQFPLERRLMSPTMQLRLRL